MADPVKPNLNIDIPTIQFSDNVSSESIPFLGEYVKGMVDFGIGFIVIIGAVVLIASGLVYAFSAGNQDRVSTAKSFIQYSLVGIAIALGSYTILYVIDPDLTEFGGLSIGGVERVELEEFTKFDIYDDDPADPANKAPDDDDGGDAGGDKPPAATVKVTAVPTSGKSTVTKSYPGEELAGQCHIVPITSFPKFNLEQVPSKGNKCMVETYFPGVPQYSGSKRIDRYFAGEYITYVNFLGKKRPIHKVAAPSLVKVGQQLQGVKSSAAKSWVSRFYTAGAYVQSHGTVSNIVAKHCVNKDGTPKKRSETWVVHNNGKKLRLFTRLLKNLHGNTSDRLSGDMHSIGLAIDVRSRENPDRKPMYTDIPKEVADIFYKNGWSWLGATAHRDAMHFQYKAGGCFKSLGRRYPTGNGCCLAGSKVGGKNKYKSCISKGGVDKTYTQCLGSGASPNTFWYKECKGKCKTKFKTLEGTVE